MVDWESFYASFRRTDFIPGYEILNHLGGGAFGEVYKARKSSIGKSYAIKFLRLDEESAREAVERELEQVRLFAAIDHPNLVTMEDMGVVEGVPYLIMGYAGEDTLARHLKQRDLDPERTMRYFVQACRGVHALHDRRLAHFDLKPSNIFLRGDVARVGDYGLAKLLVDGRQTLSFGRGTPHYMAPEMLKNRADHRADLYSLGVILYECVAGKLPWNGEVAIGVVVREEDLPPDFPEEFPQYLRPVVARLLRLEPDDRFTGVPDLLDALGQPGRQGDSVRIRFAELSPETRRLQGRADEAADAQESEEAGGDNLRRAAAEFARGAVGVARGVWDGVVERVSKPNRRTEDAEDEATEKTRVLLESARAKAAARETPKGKLAGREREPRRSEPEPARPALPPPPMSDVVSVATLEDPDPSDEEIVRASAALSAPDAPWRQELERSRDERQRGARSGLLAAMVAPEAASVSSTIPVPPRADGGLVGNVLQSVIVGGEIMGALVTGPFLVGLRGTAAAFDRVLSGVPGLIGSLLRLLMMMILMALCGGLVSLAFLAALSL